MKFVVIVWMAGWVSMCVWLYPKVTVAVGNETGFSEAEIHFGRTLGPENEFKVHFRNASGASLVIQDVFASCSCVDVSWPESPVEDGAKVIISGRFTGVSEVAVMLTATWTSVDGVQSWSSCLLRAELSKYELGHDDERVLIPAPDPFFL